MKLTVPQSLADEFTRAFPGIAIHKLELKDAARRLLLVTLCGKPEAFIADGTLVPPLQYARTQGSAKVHGATGATWQRAGLFFAELQASPEVRQPMWKTLWAATMERVDPALQPPRKAAEPPPRRRDPWLQDEPRDDQGDPAAAWFDLEPAADPWR